MNKTSDYITEIRAIRNLSCSSGEQIPEIYRAHMSAKETERQLLHARLLVAELYAAIATLCEEQAISREREDEIQGLLLLWGIKEDPNNPGCWQASP